MVRKWSYLNNSKEATPIFKPVLGSFSSGGLTLLKNRHVFKVFRTSTRFKRWTVGLTRVVRKKYTRRKHLTLFMNLNHITNCWVSFYLSQRNLTRFYHGLNILDTQYLSPLSDIVIKQATEVLSKDSSGILLLGTSSNLVKHLNYSQADKSFLKNLLSNSNSVSVNKMLIFNSDKESKTQEDLFNFVLESHDTKYSLPTNMNNTSGLQLLSSPEFSFVVSIRRIVVLLTILNSWS